MTKDQLAQVIHNTVPDSNNDINAWQSVLEQHGATPSICYLFNIWNIILPIFHKIKL